MLNSRTQESFSQKNDDSFGVSFEKSDSFEKSSNSEIKNNFNEIEDSSVKEMNDNGGENKIQKSEESKKIDESKVSETDKKKSLNVSDENKVDKDENPQVKSYVKGLQQSLNSLGEELDTDGAYGAKTSAAMSRHNVKKGMKNILAKHFQWWLKKAGIYKGEVDSSFGNQTLEAVKAAQKKVGVTADGIIGNGSAKAFMKLFQ